MKKVVSLVALLLALLLFAACTPDGMSIINATTDPSQYYTYENGEKYAVGAFAQTTEEIDALSIDWLSGSVALRGDEHATKITVRDDYVPKEGYEPYCVHTYVENGALKIKFMRYNLKISASVPAKNLTVVVPKTLELKKVSVTTSTASSIISDVSCLDFTQNSGGIGGAITTENCIYNTFFANITAGDVTIKNCNFLKKTEFVMGTGSAIMEDSRSALIEGQCRTGDFILHNCNADKADVDISLNGSAYLTDLVTKDFELTCTTGSIYAHLSDKMTDYKLDCKSPFDVVYPENMPEEGADLIYLRSTAGKIKFLPKEKIMQLLSPEEDQAE